MSFDTLTNRVSARYPALVLATTFLISLHSLLDATRLAAGVGAEPSPYWLVAVMAAVAAALLADGSAVTRYVFGIAAAVVLFPYLSLNPFVLADLGAFLILVLMSVMFAVTYILSPLMLGLTQDAWACATAAYAGLILAAEYALARRATH